MCLLLGLQTESQHIFITMAAFEQQGRSPGLKILTCHCNGALVWYLYFWSVKSFVQCKVDLSLRQALSGGGPASYFQLVPPPAPDCLCPVRTGAPSPLPDAVVEKMRSRAAWVHLCG